MAGQSREHVGHDVMHVRVRAHLDDLATCRERVADFLRQHEVAEERIDELRLVVSELASNVVLHTDRDTIDMSLSATPGWFVLDVAGAPPAALVHAASTHAPPPTSQFSGRGLMITQGVADHVDTVDTDGDRLTRCYFRRVGIV